MICEKPEQTWFFKIFISHLSTASACLSLVLKLMFILSLSLFLWIRTMFDIFHITKKIPDRQQFMNIKDRGFNAEKSNIFNLWIDMLSWPCALFSLKSESHLPKFHLLQWNLLKMMKKAFYFQELICLFIVTGQSGSNWNFAIKLPVFFLLDDQYLVGYS